MNKRYVKGVILLGLTASIGFTSCQITNKYKAPEYDSENLYRDGNSADTTSIAAIPWRQYFTDPILQGLIEEGLEKNFDLQIAFTRIKQAEANLGMAKAAYFPSVALVGQVEQTRLSAADPLTGAARERKSLAYHKETYTLGISASWELDVWGKLNRQSRATYAQFLNSHAYKNLIQTSLISNLATSYYSLLALDEQLRVTKENIEILKESAATMEAMRDAGMLTSASVEQSRALLYSTQVTVPDLENQIRQMENSICLLIGRKPESILRTSIAEQNVPSEMKFGVPAQMLALRPDVQQAELSFRQSFELVNVAKASFYPTISLSSGMIGYSTVNGLSQFFKPENLFASIVGGLTQPLFARKQLITQLKVAKAQQEESYLTFEKTVLAAGKEVSDILYTYESSLSKNELRSKQVASLNNAVYFTQELLKAGEANYTEVLTAEQSLLQAQLGQVSDKLEQLQASVDLYRALGGGIQ
ncbi:efflux transporter outer membrane subunit [Dysgonomonas macrotermitis]|uniref:Efflux transporter, outer membrane factor (OMF) lipoprotein, NodT family n=1 Tax=Dysgonomonas macrotermitis TaxID=1346286 RepID=A0A1M4YIW1_9BACT|nr:efflux transporter outer membrane subunit [Dysgonomonas macrotermitis]SHF05650.1 efflux transporter, outer membrane factor (OMF) lipoprotein, NodT family [Dysgonomonas macrotermitis]